MDQDQYISWLWQGYFEFQDDYCRNTLLEHYQFLAVVTAERIFRMFNGKSAPGHSIQKDDLINAGIFGLTEAIEKYKPGHLDTFEVFCRPFIQKAILDDLQHADWIPNSVYNQTLKLDKARENIGSDINRKLNDEQQKEHLKHLLSKGLTRAEKLIIILYYYEEMTLKEIAAVLDLSESRIKEMYSSIVARLRAGLNPH